MTIEEKMRTAIITNKKLMQMDREQTIEIVNDYARLVIKHIEVDKIVLFGSYAKATIGSTPVENLTIRMDAGLITN